MNIYKRLVIVAAVLVSSSCSLNLQEDPNAVQPSQVLSNLLLNSVQRQLPVVFNAANTTGSQMTRLVNGAGSIYLNSNTPQTFDGLWSNAYAGILADIDQLIKTSDASGFARHSGIARVIQAYTLLLLTDYFGDVPFTEAFKGSLNFNPKATKDSEIYELVLTTLDKAKIDLTTNATTGIPAGYLNPVACRRDLWLS